MINIKDTKTKIILCSILFVLLIIVLIFNNGNSIKNNGNNGTVDSNNFKNEYEALNGKDNGHGGKHLSIDIDRDNPIKYSTFDEIMEILEKGTGVIYFGFPECPWCRSAVPVLLDAADSTGLDTIYYFNAVDMRDIKELDKNGKVITTKEGSKEYKQLLDKLNIYLSVYDGLNDNSIKRLYFPTVFFIKDGVVVGKHESTVESQLDPSVKLNEEQALELKDIYEHYMLEVLGSSCGQSC